MRRLLFGLLLLLSSSVAAEETPIVVVISLDGVRWDVPDTPGLTAFGRVIREGVRSARLVPVYPSNTFPGHVSLATGAKPAVHGIVDNVFLDRSRGLYAYSADASWLRAEPLWIAAERQGVKAATYFWVGSETDWQGQGATYRKAPFDGAVPESEKVTQILEWLDMDEGQRPGLVMSYFGGSDHEGHYFGPNSRRVAQALRDQDAALSELMNGIDAMNLWSRLTLLLVSDHGMTAVGDYVDLGALLHDAGIEARVFGPSFAHVFLESAADLEKARSVLSADARLQVLSAAEASASAPPDRTGDLVVAAEPPVTFERPDGLEGAVIGLLSSLGWEFGGHGYRPELSDMGGIFLAMGRGVGRGVAMGPVQQIDLAPTVADLLGIEPPLQAQGMSLRSRLMPSNGSQIGEGKQ